MDPVDVGKLIRDWAALALLKERMCTRGPYVKARDDLIQAARDAAGDTIDRAIAAHTEADPSSQFLIRINVIHEAEFVTGGDGQLESMRVSSTRVFEHPAGPEDERLRADYESHGDNPEVLKGCAGFVIVSMACRCGTRKSPMAIRNTRIYAVHQS